MSKNERYTIAVLFWSVITGALILLIGLMVDWS